MKDIPTSKTARQREESIGSAHEIDFRNAQHASSLHPTWKCWRQRSFATIMGLTLTGQIRSKMKELKHLLIKMTPNFKLTIFYSSWLTLDELKATFTNTNFDPLQATKKTTSTKCFESGSQSSRFNQIRSFSSSLVNVEIQSWSSMDSHTFVTKGTSRTFTGAVQRNEQPNAWPKRLRTLGWINARWRIPIIIIHLMSKSNQFNKFMKTWQTKFELEEFSVQPNTFIVRLVVTFPSKFKVQSCISLTNKVSILFLAQSGKEVFWAVLPPTDGSTHEYSFVSGQRGAPKILYDGFSYICAKKSNNRKYWVCAKQRSRNCKARLITGANGRLEVSKNVFHNHGPEAPSGGKKADYFQLCESSS